MVKFRNFQQLGDILEADVIVSENGVPIKYHARYNMTTNQMEHTDGISQFVSNQGHKGFLNIAYNIQNKNQKYERDFMIAWG